MQNMTFFGSSLLFLGAHPDDIELGCGAFISDMVGKADIHCMTFSDNQKNPDLQHLVGEHYDSMHQLGLSDDQIELMQFETRRFRTSGRKFLRRCWHYAAYTSLRSFLFTPPRTSTRITKPSLRKPRVPFAAPPFWALTSFAAATVFSAFSGGSLRTIG